MLRWLKLSPHHHSGRLRPHDHTSYLPLALLLVAVGLSLGVVTYGVSAARPGPASGSIGLSGTMPGKPPTTAAVIKTPANGQRFSTSPVTISGTCPPNTLVELYKNDIFAGSTVCDDSGKFSLEVDLLIGQNILIARVYDDLNQAGPDSNSVTVFYDALPTQSSPLNSLDFGGDQLILNTDAVFRGMFPDKEFQIPLDIIGGTPAYAVNIQWGDASNSVVSRPDNSNFRTAHTYKKPGIYQISVQASDVRGRVAFITVAAIVNGQPEAAAAAAASSTPNQLLALWPLYVASVAVVISFWLGEQREKKVLLKHPPLAPAT